MTNSKKEFPLTKSNYKLLIAGIVVIVMGYILMSGGGTDNPNQFNPEIFSFRRITLAPLILLAGYGLVGYAIMKKTGE
ncbi:DUF3098 domain-containing protein [Luteibaculum oceani]|uniref:DUF3098 domain-containing protein n=1 Tax=Luteibaculum oceani TaxID=1294296 RepID=A0A5C6VL66_9FLAO|nr:DUF3098 domain-containing protein [Luteibaculum oceani]TXC85106.1 DUF3098 domain-containing protein [Luteibaculum oceani]